mgnify:CR=1 FL=1
MVIVFLFIPKGIVKKMKRGSEKTEQKKIHKLTPAQILILGFFLVITAGALLLMLPVSSAEGEFTPPNTAFFTATSATCVTGLITVDTGIYWSGFGRAVILLLIQIGGLGFMSMAMMFSMLLKRRVSPMERVVFVQSMNLFSGERMFSFIKKMLVFTFAFEGTGAVLLSVKFVPEFGFWSGISKGIFHSVSAFCNAGFDILGKSYGSFTSIEHFADDFYVNAVIGALIVCGGLGFLVWSDIIKSIKERKRLMLYSKMVLVISGLLIAVGTAVFLVYEWNNPETMGDASPGGKLLRASFMSVTCRTAGYATMPLGGLSGASKVFAMLLMFIGGSSGSCAGGIKTVTAGIILVSLFQIIKGNKDINIRKHRIESGVVTRAFVLLLTAGIAILSSCFLLSLTENAEFIDLSFEAFSAFGTVGLTTGITPTLSVLGQVIIMALMFFGRVGIITITYVILLGINKEKIEVKYPKANILIG